MRVNVYAEEMTDRIEIVTKEADGHKFTGLRFYLYLPVTKEVIEETHVGPTRRTVQVQGPFLHREGDDDSAAVTFWGKRDLREVLRQALDMLDKHYTARTAEARAALTAATQARKEVMPSASGPKEPNKKPRETPPGSAPAPLGRADDELSEVNIRTAVTAGNNSYWADAEKQRAAFVEWSSNGQKGDCPQISHGSIVDYITRSICFMLAAAPSPPVQSGEGEDNLVGLLRKQDKKLAEAREVIEPFANAGGYGVSYSEDYQAMIRVGNLRRARAWWERNSTDAKQNSPGHPCGAGG